MNMDKKHKGVYSEFRAALWFLEKGYEVYRNISQHGFCDMIVCKDKELIKVDVKTAVISKKTGFMHCSGLSENQKNEGIKILMVDIDGDRVLWAEDSEAHQFERCVRSCLMCGVEMKIDQKRRSKKLFCSPLCRMRHHNKKNSENRGELF
jgi:hypothetical protein